MTLEKIKQKQLGLNELLQINLRDLESVMDRILGAYPEEIDNRVEEAVECGLLSEIDSAQKELERKIDRLNTLKQRLYSSVFEPTKSSIEIN
jgi:hypothetical protein